MTSNTNSNTATFVAVKALEGYSHLVADLDALVENIAEFIKTNATAAITKTFNGEGAMPSTYLLAEIAEHPQLGSAVQGLLLTQMSGDNLTPALIDALVLAAGNENSPAYRECIARAVVAYTASKFVVDESVILALPNAFRTFVKQENFASFIEDFDYLIKYFILSDNRLNILAEKFTAQGIHDDNQTLEAANYISDFAFAYKSDDALIDTNELLVAFDQAISNDFPDEEVEVADEAVNEVVDQPTDEAVDAATEEPKIEDATVINVGSVTFNLQKASGGAKNTLVIRVELNASEYTISEESNEATN